VSRGQRVGTIGIRLRQFIRELGCMHLGGGNYRAWALIVASICRRAF
jgi:hypothetical protein